VDHAAKQGFELQQPVQLHACW